MTDQDRSQTRIQAQFCVPVEQSGARIDQVMAQLLPDFSRARVAHWITNGEILLNGVVCRPKQRVLGGEAVLVDASIEAQVDWSPEVMALDVLHADDDLILVNKPAGLVVHPGHGNPSGTLVNALLAQYPELEAIPRAGIVHRLDKDTSGVLAVARSLRAHGSLVGQLKDRTMGRRYVACVFGKPPPKGRVDAPLDRHRTIRTRMAVVATGKAAVTHFNVIAQSDHCAFLQVKLETGRTHQIRVHMMEIGHPLVGDPVYRQGRPGLGRAAAPVRALIESFPRQALHALELSLRHPTSGHMVDFVTPWPADLIALKEGLDAFDIGALD